jgi:hypothetical protein
LLEYPFWHRKETAIEKEKRPKDSDNNTYEKYFQTRQRQKNITEAWKGRELVEGGRQGSGAGWAARRGEVAARGVQAGRTVGDVPGSGPCSKYWYVV